MTGTSFYQFEVQRLLLMLTQHCHNQVYDSKKVRATVADWAYSLTKSAMGFCYEDETMNKTIGMRVNRVGGNPGTGTGHAEYGIIVNNIAAYTAAEEPFAGLQEVSAEDKIRWQYLAGLTMVSWFLEDGTLSFTSWEDLKNLTAAESSNAAD
jgi:hypothetical protein